MPKALRSSYRRRVRSLMRLLLIQRSILGNALCTLIAAVGLSAMAKALRSSTLILSVGLTAVTQHPQNQD